MLEESTFYRLRKRQKDPTSKVGSMINIWYNTRSKDEIKLVDDFSHTQEITLDTEIGGKKFGISVKAIERATRKKFDVVKFDDFNEKIMNLAAKKHWVRVTLMNNKTHLHILAYDERDARKATGKYIAKNKRVSKVDMNLIAPTKNRNDNFILDGMPVIRHFLKFGTEPSVVQRGRLAESNLLKIDFKDYKKYLGFKKAAVALGLAASVVGKGKSVFIKSPKDDEDQSILMALATDYSGNLDETAPLLASIEALSLSEDWDSIDIGGTELSKDDASTILLMRNMLNDSNQDSLDYMMETSRGINIIVEWSRETLRRSTL